MIKNVVAVIALVMVATLSVAGCTAATDYSNYYNKKAWDGSVIEAFYKFTDTGGNDFYIGEIRRGAEPPYTVYTCKFEHVSSQGEAAHVYKDAVASAVNDGFLQQAFSTSADQPIPAERWLGTRNSTYIYLAYYNNPDVNSWIVEKQFYF